MKLDTNPYKGARDFYPSDKRIQNYIFNTWRKVCVSYGFEEYDAPFIEPFELYAAKSGEELVNTQLYSFTDKGERKVAIRPEMTPSVSRMVASKYQELIKPIKWFSIANFWRYEKPQKGRQREFYQLNADIFGVDNVTSDFEILSLNKRLMDEFGAKPNMYEVRVNNRKLIDYYFDEIGIENNLRPNISRVIDNKDKIDEKTYTEKLKKEGLSQEQIKNLKKVFEMTLEVLATIDNEGAKEIVQLFTLLKSQTGFENVIFDPYIVRGLDYYDGMIFEQKDLTPENNRSMFGGGRYNGLISLFIDKQVPATGFAQGDVPLKLFLESWNLLPNFENEIDVLITVFPSSESKKQLEFFSASQKTANKLRSEGKNVEVYPNFDTKLGKQLDYANRKGIKTAIIIGEDELKSGEYTIKELT